MVGPNRWVMRIGSGAILAGLAGGIGLAWAAETTVIQKSIAFEPAQITIKPGDSVVFVNQDGFGHNVYSASAGGQFDIGLQAPNQRTALPPPMSVTWPRSKRNVTGSLTSLSGGMITPLTTRAPVKDRRMTGNLTLPLGKVA